MEFKGKYNFLSNFALCPVTYEGMLFPTVEHAYQAAKTRNWDERERVRKARSAGDAKRLGKRVTLRADWDQQKLHVMDVLLHQKFAVEPFRSALLETGNDEIVHDNWWHDTYWGMCVGVGENHLGKLIMAIRHKLTAPAEWRAGSPPPLGSWIAAGEPKK